jgi:anti-sigma factor RsiW
MDNDRLEILMGKFIDGEIEPSEQRLLDIQLARDPQSRRWFEEFKVLHSMARAELAPLAETGRSFDAIFSTAWKKSRRGRYYTIHIPLGLGRFVAGMAAGLMLAAMVWVSTRSLMPQTVPAPDAVSRVAVEPDVPDRIIPRKAMESSSPVIKNVDYYYYTDEHGQRWMIEGFRENVKPKTTSHLDI